MSRPNDPAEGKNGPAIRTFICIETPEAIKERISALERSLQHVGAQVSWVKPSNIHLTLKFLGDVPRSRIGALRRGVERAIGPGSQFELEVEGAGCFPSPRNPRVLWVGVGDPSGGLKQAHRAIETELEREGFPREAKAFSPHLTIGRVRSPRGSKALAEELTLKGFQRETFRVSEIIIMRSDLKPTGSLYTPQAVISIGSAPHQD